MRSHRPILLLAGAALALGCSSSPGATSAPRPAEPAAPIVTDVFQPATGVTCNRTTEVCEYRGGPTIGLTRLFFGDAAADNLALTAGVAREHDPIFRPGAGATCDTLVTTCYDENGASNELTRKFFGANGETRLEKRKAAEIFRPARYVTCDRQSKVCFDKMGAGYGVTRLYLGEAEAQALLQRLQGWRRS